MISIKHGETIYFLDDDIETNKKTLNFFQFLTHKKINPVKEIKTKRINGEKALFSPLIDLFLDFGFKKDIQYLSYRYGYSDF